MQVFPAPALAPHQLATSTVQASADGLAACAIVAVVILVVLLRRASHDRRRLERTTDQLARSKRELQAITESLPTGVFRVSPNGTITFANSGLKDIIGGANFMCDTAPIHPEDLAGVMDGWAAAAAANEGYAGKFRVVRATGEIRWIEVECQQLTDEDAQSLGWVGSVWDTTEEIETLSRLKQLSEIVEATPDHVAMIDVNGVVTHANAAMRKRFEIPLAGPLPQIDAVELYASSDRERFMGEAIQIAERDGEWIGEVDLQLFDGTTVPVSQVLVAHRHPDGSLAFYSSITRDLSEQRGFEAELARAEWYDAVTGLPNRAYFIDAVTHSLDRAARAGTRIAVLLADVDHFKLVNDSLGHAAGDDMLRVVADRLRVAAGPAVLLARFGSDEFCLLVEEIGGEADAIEEALISGVGTVGVADAAAEVAHAAISDSASSNGSVADAAGPVLLAERIAEQVGRPIELGNDTFFVTVSTGIAMSSSAQSPSAQSSATQSSTAQAGPEAGSEAADVEADTSESLLRDATAALHRAKERGRARAELFIEDFRDAAVSQLRTASDLHRALAGEEFRVVYQPEIDLRTGHVVGVEALVRWHHPVRGLVSPAEFIPLAEQTGLITGIGAWVLDVAIKQAAEWAAQHDSNKLLTWVNLSARQLGDSDLVELVAKSLERHGVEPEQLGLEITETALLEDAEGAVAAMTRLRALGVRLAIDDFGTGYSSLSYLKRLPVDAVKIDRTFVDGLVDNGDDSAIVAAVAGMARALQLTTIAEGVETVGQLFALRRLGCDLAQGYLFSTPRPPEDITALLERDRTAALFAYDDDAGSGAVALPLPPPPVVRYRSAS